MDNIRPADWTIGGGGLVLIIASFLPWYHWNIGGFGLSVSTGAGYGWLCFVLGLAALVWVGLRAFEVVNLDFPFPEGLLYIGAGGLAGLIAVLRLLFRPGGGGINASPYIGIFVALAGAAAVIVGGIIKLREV